MKRNNERDDRLMDALLREDATGGADEEFLAEVGKAIEASHQRTERRAMSRVSGQWWACAAILAVSVIGVWAFVAQSQSGKSEDATAGTPNVQPDPQHLAALEAERLEKLIREQEDLVEEKRKQFHSIVKAVGIPYIEGARESGQIGQMGRSEEDVLRIAQMQEYEKKTEKQKLDSQIKTLLRLRNEELMQYAAGLNLPDNGVPRLYEQYQMALRNISSLRASGLDAKHPQVLMAKIAAEELERDLQKGVTVLEEILQTQLALVDSQLQRERYGQLVDQPWKAPWQDPLSTFSVDVDTASYTNIRRMLRGGEAIPRDGVRIEECVNYFDYAYPAPQNGGPFAVHVEMANCPWQPRHHLVKVGLKGRGVDTNTRPPSNLVFLIDVSGSMRPADKLPLLIESMKVLVEELDERDSVGIVVYAGSAGTVLEPTKVVGEGRTEILRALDSLRAGGSTAGAAGIAGAYELAARNFLKDGVNRVILATDGDFNVGTSSDGALVDLVKEKAQAGVFLSVLGFGTGNLNDGMMEAITNDGNGNYYYIDSEREGRKVFLQNLSGTLVTIAKDVKIQVEFNPGKVAAYRLIGYANRILPPEAFNDDTVDAGEIGAGHTVTALYEIVPAGVEPPQTGGVDALKYQQPANRTAVASPEWMTVKLRYKAPDGDTSKLLEVPVEEAPVEWTRASADLQFAAGVALFGEKLRGSDKIEDAGWELVAELAQRGGTRDPHGHRAEFRELVQLAGRFPQAEPEREEAPPPQGIEAPPVE